MQNTITESTLVQRINRRYVAEARANGGWLKRLRKSRPRELDNLGRYHIVDGTNTVRDWHVDVARLARDLGVMGPDETLAA